MGIAYIFDNGGGDNDASNPLNYTPNGIPDNANGDTISVQADIWAGTVNAPIISCSANLYNATFNFSVTNDSGHINSGIFNSTVTDSSGNNISGGTFHGFLTVESVLIFSVDLCDGGVSINGQPGATWSGNINCNLTASAGGLEVTFTLDGGSSAVYDFSGCGGGGINFYCAGTIINTGTMIFPPAGDFDAGFPTIHDKIVINGVLLAKPEIISIG